ncbi:hypothetical protein ACO34A_24090 (plasmid) [Rhizobium sp. ACO-34A]|nr:extracellular solute-binding protein [Rhizobium sp. ACO-34A]ATN36860.1 hypothetical protein ACO34A_24090 [Rhizobium sp. ACO-34A]
MSMLNKLKASAISAGLVLLAITGASAAQVPAELVPLYGKAKTAGAREVVVYTPYGNHDPLWKAFNEDFPEFSVNAVVITGAPLATRLQAEKATGNHAGDIVIGNASATIAYKELGYLDADTPPTVGTLPARFKDPEGYFQIPFTNLFTLIYNTRLVAEADVPRTLDEILSDKWKGKFTYGRVRGTGATDTALATLDYNGALTPQQLRLIHDNSVESDGNGPAIQAVAQGRLPFDLWAPTQSVVPLQKDGAPLGIRFLEDSSIVFGPGVALLAGSPNRDAAKLLKAWLYTPRAQAIYAAATNSYGTIPGTPLPAGLPSVDTYRFKDIPAAEANTYLHNFQKKTQPIWEY